MLNNFIISTYKFFCFLFVFSLHPSDSKENYTPGWFNYLWAAKHHMISSYFVRQKGNRDLNTWIFVLKGTSKGHGVQIPCNEQGCLQLDHVAQNPVQLMLPRMGHLPPFWAAWFWILCFLDSSIFQC